MAPFYPHFIRFRTENESVWESSQVVLACIGIEVMFDVIWAKLTTCWNAVFWAHYDCNARGGQTSPCSKVVTLITVLIDPS
jgi:hypothetical protein